MPAFIGATYAYAYHRQHNIDLHETPIPIAVDTIRVNRLLHFGQIASTIDLPIEVLRQLNPQYKLDIIPATTKPYTLILPAAQHRPIHSPRAGVHAKDSTYLKEYMNPVNLNKKLREGILGTTYIVKRGDTLGAIARRYHVTVSQLIRWNNIRNAKAFAHPDNGCGSDSAMQPDHDTIFAPATATGGAIAVIRISGDEAFTVCDRIFLRTYAARRNRKPYRSLRTHRRW